MSLCLCCSFQIHSRPDQVVHRNILAILDSSMKDHPQETGAENEMRYKLIIDSSEDNSVIRLLFSTGVLKREKTRMYMCSDFHGDSQLQKVILIAINSRYRYLLLISVNS